MSFGATFGIGGAAVALAIGLAAAAIARAQEPEPAPEPVPAEVEGEGEDGDGDDEGEWAATNAAEVVPAGHVQLEAGIFYEDRAPGQRWALGTPLAFRVGVVPRLEARVGFDAIDAFRDDEGHIEEGFGDVEASLKFRTNEQVGLFPLVSLEPFVKAPTAHEEKDLGSGELDFGLRVHATDYFLDELFYIDLSVQAAWLGKEGSHSQDFYYQTSTFSLLGYEGVPDWTFYASCLWETEEEPGRHVNDSVVLSLGGFWFPKRWLAFDMGVDWGVGPEDADWGLFFTVLYLAGPFWTSDE